MTGHYCYSCGAATEDVHIFESEERGLPMRFRYVCAVCDQLDRNEDSGKILQRG